MLKADKTHNQYAPCPALASPSPRQVRAAIAGAKGSENAGAAHGLVQPRAPLRHFANFSTPIPGPEAVVLPLPINFVNLDDRYGEKAYANGQNAVGE
jgi:hypothetical protein